jgi:hypothetical protein
MGSLLDKALKLTSAMKDSTPTEIVDKLEKGIPLKIEKVGKPKKPTFEVGDVILGDGGGDFVKQIVGQIVGQKKENVGQKGKKLMVSTPDPAKALSKGKTKKGRVFAFVGKHGTGKTYACCNFADKFKKTLLLDTEYKTSEILDEQYPELRYDMKEPIKDVNKKHSQIFKNSSDIHIDVCQVINPTTGKRDDIATAQYIIKNTPIYLKLIASGKYKNFIIDSCSPIWEYALKMWLKKNKRQRPNKFEFGEIEAIKQDIILPFVNYCKIYGVNLILTFGIAGHYVNDVMIGYKEEAKQWLLNIFSYELWFEYDYQKYCIKHPYKTFWCIKDEDLDIADYLFDKEFINEDVEYKEFEEFKYESLTSVSYRKEVKKREGLVIR